MQKPRLNGGNHENSPIDEDWPEVSESSSSSSEDSDSDLNDEVISTANQENAPTDRKATSLRRKKTMFWCGSSWGGLPGSRTLQKQIRALRDNFTIRHNLIDRNQQGFSIPLKEALSLFFTGHVANKFVRPIYKRKGRLELVFRVDGFPGAGGPTESLLSMQVLALGPLCRTVSLLAPLAWGSFKDTDTDVMRRLWKETIEEINEVFQKGTARYCVNGKEKTVICQGFLSGDDPALRAVLGLESNFKCLICPVAGEPAASLPHGRHAFSSVDKCNPVLLVPHQIQIRMCGLHCVEAYGRTVWQHLLQKYRDFREYLGDLKAGENSDTTWAAQKLGRIPTTEELAAEIDRLDAVFLFWVRYKLRSYRLAKKVHRKREDDAFLRSINGDVAWALFDEKNIEFFDKRIVDIKAEEKQLLLHTKAALSMLLLPELDGDLAAPRWKWFQDEGCKWLVQFQETFDKDNFKRYLHLYPKHGVQLLQVAPLYPFSCDIHETLNGLVKRGRLNHTNNGGGRTSNRKGVTWSHHYDWAVQLLVSRLFLVQHYMAQDPDENKLLRRQIQKWNKMQRCFPETWARVLGNSNVNSN